MTAQSQKGSGAEPPKLPSDEPEHRSSAPSDSQQRPRDHFPPSLAAKGARDDTGFLQLTQRELARSAVSAAALSRYYQLQGRRGEGGVAFRRRMRRHPPQILEGAP